jgi:Spy/CpxP family protein refolding chaperone
VKPSNAQRLTLRQLTIGLTTAAVLLAGAVDLGAAASVFRVAAFGQAPAAGAADEPTVTPFELQRLFDSYALLQAQEQLKIGDEQYTKFLPRFKALQDVRRQALQQRTRVLNDVRRLLAEVPSDDGLIKDRLKQLQDIEGRGDAEARKAYEAIDQVLDVRQQAQFRLFEEQMERRKLELVTRARQANRANARPLQRQPNRLP